MKMFANQKKHPSFGMIDIVRGTSSGKQNLFGSSIQQQAFIKLEISRAILNRDIYHDDYFPISPPLISVYMSPSQWADAITSLNTTGVPCTIEWFNGENIEAPPFESKRVQFDEEFKKKLEDTASETNEFITKIKEILAKPNIGKKDREEILQQIDMIRMQIASNIPYIKKSFTEQMDQTVIEAKNEVSHLIEERLKALGLEKLKDQLSVDRLPELEDKKEEVS
jgi:hypothetical protein